LATAVLNIDFQNLPEEITGLSTYKKAFILLRFKGKPLGKIVLPVYNGSILIKDYYNHLLDAAGINLWNSWLHEYLNYDEKDLIRDFVRPKATVAICTRNRTDDLKRCLDALMQMPDDGQEFLVVDNCPSDDSTKNLVAAYNRVTYVLEPRPGLNIARNRALTEASNEVIAFTDDDATPDVNWLRSIVNNFNSALVMCVTGLTLPLELETDGQEAFEKYSPFGKGFRRKVHTSQTRNPLSTGEVGAGANMALRKTALSEVGYFDEALDAGTATQSGGDHEYFARILIAGYHIVYEPEALSWHRHRKTLEETRKAIYGYGVGVYAFWTRLLFVEREYNILNFPWYWFRYSQFPNLINSLFKRQGSQPLNLVLAELKGCIIGPSSYFKARRRLKKAGNEL
jgi:glycosyltransferase involved in cell wall biosynthesis